jgi:NAD(P)-dependent dehydrogenase (short-subunit alcohol dehydrogenase family)
VIAAVVTGAAMGIGEATAKRLVNDGAVVVGVDLNAQALAETAKTIGERFVPLVGDISEPRTHDAAASRASDLGDLKWWVNNAGIDVSASAHEITPEHVEGALRVLLAGPIYGMSAAVRAFRAGGGGVIVNVASIQGRVAFPRALVYQAAKAGVLAATRNIAVEYATKGIRCNAVLPGTIATPMTMAALDPAMGVDEALKLEGELSPMRRVGAAEEVAAAIAFLLSDDSSYINGAELPIDGGSVARCFAYPVEND